MKEILTPHVPNGSVHKALMENAIRHILEGALIGRNVLAPPDKDLLLEALTPPVPVAKATKEELLEVDDSIIPPDMFDGVAVLKSVMVPTPHEDPKKQQTKK